MQEPARVAIDLGAESCRVSLLRWENGKPNIGVVHRIPNGPVHRGDSLHWAIDTILAGLEEGLRRAAQAAPEGIASIGVDSWGVDYVRVGADGRALREPFCYRDERTVASKEAADKIIPPFEMYQRTGVFPMRLNTVYQLMADPAAGIDPRAHWIMMPEFILHSLGARRVSEYTHATHTGLVDLKTGDWSEGVFRELNIPIEEATHIVHAATAVKRVQGP
jgi:rhamnulokinase